MEPTTGKARSPWKITSLNVCYTAHSGLSPRKGIMVKEQSLEETLREERDRLKERVAAIDVLLGDQSDMLERRVSGDGDGPERRPPARRGPGVSEAILRTVREYMENCRITRQSDIAKDLKLNSGAVSLALRWLESEGDVEDTEKIDRRSKVWKFTGESSRATNVNVGEGVEPGRRK